MEKFPKEQLPDVVLPVFYGEEQIDLQQFASRFQAAVTAGTGVRALLQEADRHFESARDGNALVSAIADTCTQQPHILENADFWATYVERRSPFFVALLERLASRKDCRDVGARAQILLMGYLGRHDPDDAAARIAELSARVSAYLGCANDPDSERLLARQQYEDHRVHHAQAEKYLEAVKDLSLEKDSRRIQAVQEQHREQCAALCEAIGYLRSSFETDVRFGHGLFANQTYNRIVALQMEGRLISASAACDEFARLDASYQNMDPTSFRAGDGRLLLRFHANTVDRLAQALELCDRRDEAQVARTRFAQMQVALEH